jgi:microcompartment protein CcmK/EutM
LVCWLHTRSRLESEKKKRRDAVTRERMSRGRGGVATVARGGGARSLEAEKNEPVCCVMGGKDG